MSYFLTQRQARTDKSRSKEPISKKPSITRPNEALSIDEMFKRFSRNQPVTGTTREPIYYDDAKHEDTDFEKLNRADLVDKEEYAKALAGDMENMKKRDEERRVKEAKAIEEEEEKRFAAYMERKKQQQPNVPPKDTPPPVV